MATINLDLPELMAQRLRTRAAEQGRDVTTVAVEIIEKALEKPPEATNGGVLTGDAWVQAFDAWVKSHPGVDVVLDDSRETIYEGR